MTNGSAMPLHFPSKITEAPSEVNITTQLISILQTCQHCEMEKMENISYPSQ